MSEKQSEISAEVKLLINREADMMNRGRKNISLAGVRERILKLFLYYIQNEEMNPEITLVKVRKMNAKMRKTVHG